MTRIIDLKEVINVGSEYAVYIHKGNISTDDLLIAQSETEEEWYDIKSSTYGLPLKTGYTMYILSKHVK
jgi:hypothetical protein